MKFDAAEFYFKAPYIISRARRVLIKPNTCFPQSSPVATSREILTTIIKGIRQVSDADILLLDGTADGTPVQPLYQTLGYDYPRVLTLDVNDCTWVEVDNPLPKPLAVQTFWVPNVVLSSDYLISAAPSNVVDNMAYLSIMNLLSLLPSSKYGDGSAGGWEDLYSLDINKVLADLYFTLPFDLGIIESRRESGGGKEGQYGQVFVGEPLQVDLEASQALGIKANYLDFIRAAEEELEE